MRSVHFIAVNYYGARAVACFLASLRAQSCEEWSLTIVDNSEDPAEVDRLQALADADHRIQIAAAPRNLGYFGGAHWCCAKGSAPIPEWTIVCNVDLELAKDFVRELVDSDQGQYVTAPAILAEPGGRQQNPFMRNRPSVGVMFVRALVFRWWPVARMYGRVSSALARTRRGGPVGPAHEIYAAHGSILPIHRRFFEAGGTLAHPVFLFNEELTIAEFVKRIGGAVRFEPRVRVVHREHQSTGRARPPRILRMQRDAAWYGYQLIRRG